MKFLTDMFEKDSKNWDEQLKHVGVLIHKIEETIGADSEQAKAELSKKYTDEQAVIAKVNKEIEITQTQFHKAQLEFEKHLLLPFKKVNSMRSPEMNEIELLKISRR